MSSEVQYPFPLHRRYADPDKGDKFCKRRKKFGFKDFCPFCNEAVDGGSIILVVSNSVGIPNTIVHADCWGDDDLAASQQLAELHAKAKSAYAALERSGWTF